MASLESLKKDVDKLLESQMVFNSKDLNTLTKKEKSGWYFDHDKFKEITFITKRALLADKIRLYIGVRDSHSMYLRFVTNYHGSSWVFAESIIFIVDGEKYEFELKENSRDVTSMANVVEKYDTSVDENIYKILQKIANSDSKVEYRFRGKYVADRSLSEKQKQGIKETLEFFEFLKSQ